MARAKKVCSKPGCPAIVPAAGRCPEHQRQADKARGTRQQRGYDADHGKLRARWARTIAQGPVLCARCEQPITRDMDWHLDHTDDRAGYLGPSHMRCNLEAAGRAAHQDT